LLQGFQQANQARIVKSQTEISKNGMNYFLLVSGILIVILNLIDLAWTSLSLEGGGWLTKRITKGAWQFALFVTQRNPNSILLSVMGFVSIGMILITWILLMWTGNVLIYCSVTDNLLDQYGVFHNALADKVYFTGYVLSTMGAGDLVPVQGPWQVYTAFVSFSGLIIITIAITYLVPVLNAIVHERSIAHGIYIYGPSPQEFLRNAYNGKDFSDLDDVFKSINKQLLEHIQHHKAYPVMTYFHTSEQQGALAIQMVVLDEALSVLIHCVPQSQLPNELHLHALRKTINIYLKTVSVKFSHKKESYIDEDIDLAAAYDGELKDIIPDVKKIRTDYKPLRERREILGAYLHFKAWTWNNILQHNDMADLSPIK
jgi:hypothetical protein